MRIDGIRNRSELAGYYRDARAEVERISVRPSQVAPYEAQGWETAEVLATKVRMKRPRTLDTLVELQAWRVLYLCGFPHLSGAGGAVLVRGEDVKNQLDAVAYDENAGVVVECKSSVGGASNVDVQAALAVLNDNRAKVREVLNLARARGDKLKVGGILVLYNVPFTDADKRRAAELKLTILDSSVLSYYERLTGLIGSAARYQLYGELFQGQDIPNLQLRLPAVEFTMGESKAYSFAISPASLLKIAFVAHRGRGDHDTYQRMITKRRLRDIQHFIDDGGVFPTNIVINFQSRGTRGAGLRFDAAAATAGASDASRLGYLCIPPVYQSAWVIDGQHRLLAYSDHRWASTAALTVTAFDGLAADKQAELFEKINSTQKKVSGNLLAELFATLHWNSPDHKLQVRAVSSQLAQDMRATTASPLHGRILCPDDKATLLRCITLAELVSGLQRPGLFIRAEDHGVIRQYGVLWAGTPDASHKRGYEVTKSWFATLREACRDMWDAGNDESAGLVATNRGVNAALRLLAWALGYLRKNDADADVWATEVLVERLEPFARQVGEFFGQLTAEDIAAFRKHYGTGAPVEIAYSAARFIHERVPDFAPEKLLEWISEKEAVNVNEALRLCNDLEARLITGVLGCLKAQYGPDGWWRQLPTNVRKDAAARREEEPDDHPVEHFLYLIDFRPIIQQNWDLFQGQYAIGASGKESGTKWLVELNAIRKRADHAAGARLKPADIEVLREITATLDERGL